MPDPNANHVKGYDPEREQFHAARLKAMLDPASPVFRRCYDILWSLFCEQRPEDELTVTVNKATEKLFRIAFREGINAANDSATLDTIAQQEMPPPSSRV